MTDACAGNGTNNANKTTSRTNMDISKMELRRRRREMLSILSIYSAAFWTIKLCCTAVSTSASTGTGMGVEVPRNITDPLWSVKTTGG
jgi:hypothetical protein